jgi:hypothetical protein
MSYKETETATATYTAADSLADDLLRGIKPIAAFIGENDRRAYYLCEKGYIPAGKTGGLWIASKRALRAHFAKITAGATP